MEKSWIDEERAKHCGDECCYCEWYWSDGYYEEGCRLDDYEHEEEGK